MPDLSRSTAEMLEEMKKTLQQPEGNTSCAKHRQNVASAISSNLGSYIFFKKQNPSRPGMK